MFNVQEHINSFNSSRALHLRIQQKKNTEYAFQKENDQKYNSFSRFLNCNLINFALFIFVCSLFTQ